MNKFLAALVFCFVIGCSHTINIGITPFQIDGYKGLKLYALSIENVDVNRINTYQEAALDTMHKYCKGDELKIVLALTPKNTSGGVNIVFVFGCKPKDKSVDRKNENY